ncbi:MAG: 50S ribosomal protein L6 [Planctomycetota bacterium]|jgi:large subunit ribosomal protein L6
MSRIGKKPVSVPSGVSVSVADRCVTVEKSGSASLQFTHRPEVSVSFDDGEKAVSVSITDGFENDRLARALWGTTRAHINNMVEGVTKGFEKRLQINGVGYSAVLAGQKLQLKVGYANTVEVDVPQGLDVKVENQIVTVRGADKHKVGQFASKVKAVKKPEPYNGKGIQYTDEVIRRKQGKVFGS